MDTNAERHTVTKKPNWLVIFLVLVVMSVCAILGYFAFQNSEASSQVSKLYTFAQNVGYIPETQLAQYKTCWGIFPTHCGQVLYFATSLSREEFQAKIDQYAPSVGLPNEVDGYTLLDINLVTEYRVSIDGRTDSLDRALTPEPVAYGWLDTEGGDYWVITFYEIAQDGHVYKMDDKQITGNIVTLMLRTK